MGYSSRNNNFKEAGGMINEINLSQNRNIQIRASSMAINDKMIEN